MNARDKTTAWTSLDRHIKELLLQGCNNNEIAKELHIPVASVKSRLNRLFSRFGITSGAKRVKLATILSRTQRHSRMAVTACTPPHLGHQRVIELVAQGLNNREVAMKLGTTEDGIKNRLRIIFDEVGVWNRLELALWYQARTGQQLQ